MEEAGYGTDVVNPVDDITISKEIRQR